LSSLFYLPLTPIVVRIDIRSSFSRRQEECNNIYNHFRSYQVRPLGQLTPTRGYGSELWRPWERISYSRGRPVTGKPDTGIGIKTWLDQHPQSPMPGSSCRSAVKDGSRSASITLARCICSEEPDSKAGSQSSDDSDGEGVANASPTQSSSYYSSSSTPA
jgi:hypothetical protein